MRFALTAGHGGSDPGNTKGGEREADLMTDLRYMVAHKLRQEGHTVNEDGGHGENWPLPQAIRLISSCDLAVELHTNASENPTASGVEVVSLPIHRETSQRIASAIGKVLQIPVRRDAGWLSAYTVQKERGFLPGFTRFGGLIVEVFFQSNARDLATYKERKWLVASAIARAMQETQS